MLSICGMQAVEVSSNYERMKNETMLVRCHGREKLVQFWQSVTMKEMLNYGIVKLKSGKFQSRI